MNYYVLLISTFFSIQQFMQRLLKIKNVAIKQTIVYVIKFNEISVDRQLQIVTQHTRDMYANGF